MTPRSGRGPNRADPTRTSVEVEPGTDVARLWEVLRQRYPGLDRRQGLEWVVDNHKKHRITVVNLAPVDDLSHGDPIPTEIDAPLRKLRSLGIWVSAPTGNHNFTTGISWPACQPACFAIGAVRPGEEAVHLDRRVHHLRGPSPVGPDPALDERRVGEEAIQLLVPRE